jgi:spermidine synthase
MTRDELVHRALFLAVEPDWTHSDEWGSQACIMRWFDTPNGINSFEVCSMEWEGSMPYTYVVYSRQAGDVTYRCAPGPPAAVPVYGPCWRHASLKRFERLDETTSPDGTVLTLYRHDGAYYLRADGVELMSTRRHHSETRLAQLVCAPLRSSPSARVLIGGLGFAFTLRAALRELGDDARVLVAELLDAVIRWNRDPEYELGADALGDPRVTMRHDDVANVLVASPGRFDGIILDVDNGADALTTSRNARLYRDAGIRTAAAALRPGGRLAYWSADKDPALAAALGRTGLAVERHSARAHATSGPRHFLYVGRAE